MPSLSLEYEIVNKQRITMLSCFLVRWPFQELSDSLHFSIIIITTCLDIHFLMCIRKPLSRFPIWQEVYIVFSQRSTSDSAFGCAPKTLSYASIMKSLDLPKNGHYPIPHYPTSPSVWSVMLLISTSLISLHKLPHLIEEICSIDLPNLGKFMAIKLFLKEPTISP